MQSLDIKQNYFALFGLKPDFRIDMSVLRERQQRLQSQYHPDRFINGSDLDKRLSVQGCSWINQAYETLSDPVMRAGYLLELHGIERGDDSETTSDRGFLMEQIELREEIDDCQNGVDRLHCYDCIADKLSRRFEGMEDEFCKHLVSGEYQGARSTSKKMQFIQRVQQQLSELQFELEDF